jgi:hypothetical protein
MASTYDLIATQTLGSTAASITFSSIAASWTDLRLIFHGTMTASAGVYLRYNNNTSLTYSWILLYSDGSSALSSRPTDTAGFNLGPAAFQTSTPGMAQVDIFSYAGATNKTALLTQSLDLNGSGFTSVSVSNWPSTAAITRIDLINQSSTTFAVGTVVSLYGIKAA